MGAFNVVSRWATADVTRKLSRTIFSETFLVRRRNYYPELVIVEWPPILWVGVGR